MDKFNIPKSPVRVLCLFAIVLFTCSCTSHQGAEDLIDVDAGNSKSGASGSDAGRESTNRGSSTYDANAGDNDRLPNSSSDALCAEADIFASRVMPTITLLVDGSGTMDENFRSTTDSRWKVLREALMDKKTGAVKPVEEILEIGLSIFSGSTGDQCPFEDKYSRVAPAKDNYGAMAHAYPVTRRSGISFTATSYALDKVCSELPSRDQVIAEGKGGQYIILATDGNPNGCPGVDFEADNLTPPNNFSSAEMAAKSCAAKGITIFVLSLADEIDQEHLQRMANIGAGTDNAAVYQPSDPDALTQDLKKLIKGTMSCQIKLDITKRDNRSAIDEDLLGCDKNGGSVKFEYPDIDKTKAIPCGPDGWIMTDSEHIELQGQACEDFKSNPGIHLTAEFPCDSLVLL